MAKLEPRVYWRHQPEVRALRWALLVLALLILSTVLFLALQGGRSTPAPMIWPVLMLPFILRPPLYALSGGILAVLSPQGTREAVPLVGAVIQRLSPASLSVTWFEGKRKRRVRVDADEGFTAAVIMAAQAATAAPGAASGIQMAMPPAPAWVWWILGLLPVALAAALWQHQPAYLSALAVVVAGMGFFIRERRYVLAGGELVVVSQQREEVRMPAGEVTVIARTPFQVTLLPRHPEYPRLPVALAGGGRDLVQELGSRPK